MKGQVLCLLLGLSMIWQTPAAADQAETRHVWEKVEITLQSQRQYENPYTDVQVWVDLRPVSLTFQHVLIDEQPPQNPWIKIVGDLNADGRLDVIIGGSKGPLVWYRNPDWKKFVIAEGGYNTVAGAAVDIDRDGDLDLALGGVVWFEHPGPKGDPSKGPWAAHEIEGRRGHDLLAADLDRDGRVDLVMRDQSSFGAKTGHSIFLYQQLLPDKWTTRELRCGEGEGIQVADLNGDGRPEIVIGGSWFESSGDLLHGPWTEHVFSSEWNYPHTKVAVGDLNGDGRPDLLGANHGGPFQPVEVWLNQGK